MRNLDIIQSKKLHELEVGVKAKKIKFTGKKQFSQKTKKTFLIAPKKFNNPKSNLNYKNKKYLQDCTAKVSYRPTMEAHLKNLEYIQKEGKNINGGKPELYGNCTLEEYKEKMVEKNWRIILSPNSNDINLNLLTEEVIKKIEQHTGYKLNWVAANHYDTAHHHTHILINGIDKNGRDVFFPPEFIKSVIREYSKKICTNMIGYKTENDYEKKLKNNVSSNYFTQLDKTIQKYQNNNIVGTEYFKNKYSNLITDRLQYLISLNLCSYNKNTKQFTLNNNWEEELRKYGKYNTYLEGFSYANTTPENYYLHNIKENGNIKGTVLKRFTMQKDSNNFAILLKTEDNKVAYVPLPFYPRDCFNGDTIEISNNQNKINIKKR